MVNDAAPVDADRIRQRAFELWEQDDRPEGRELEYWLRAEAELAGEGASGLEAPPSGGAGPDLAPAQGNASTRSRGQGKTAGPTKAAGSEDPTTSAERGEYVQQRRTRKKAEG